MLFAANPLLVELSEYWLSNDVLTWGVGPLAAANLGFWGTVWATDLFLPFMSSDLISWNNKPREESRAKTNAKISQQAQYAGAFTTMCGPAAWFNAFLSWLIYSWLFTMPAELLPGLQEFLVHFLALQLVGDFFLYWGHRVQHESDYLWQHHHSYHHQLDTPSPMSTVYIDSLDATLQGGLPILLASVTVYPHPVTLYLYIVARIAENTINHSGVDHWLVDALFMKFLPFRAPIAHHDYHHKFSNHASNAKNFGENWTLWDNLFGTMSHLRPSTPSSRSRSAAKARSE